MSFQGLAAWFRAKSTTSKYLYLVNIFHFSNPRSNFKLSLLRSAESPKTLLWELFTQNIGRRFLEELNSWVMSHILDITLLSHQMSFFRIELTGFVQELAGWFVHDLSFTYIWMFPKIGVPPQIIHFSWGFPLFSPCILGVKLPYFWVQHPYLSLWILTEHPWNSLPPPIHKVRKRSVDTVGADAVVRRTQGAVGDVGRAMAEIQGIEAPVVLNLMK